MFQGEEDSSGESARLWARWGAAADGARVTLTRSQGVITGLVFGLLVSLGIWAGWQTLIIMATLSITAAYLISGVHKLSLLGRAMSVAEADRYSAAANLAAGDLPPYTVLVPLHREGAMLPHLLARLDALDYPRDRLEVLLLIEATDGETIKALSGLGPAGIPSHMYPVIVPKGHPQTKPRALNVGLNAAKGRYVVIYDAEDHPDADQLRKAAAAFAVLPDEVVCLQAKLNFYNARQTWLTRLFATDYILWYALVLPGLSRSSAFIPLGGTSNHFRITPLRRMGGWDPWNVTEDADLGIRIGRSGLRVRMLDSTTWEEAVPRVRPWIRQRSRWIKGYMQTYLVHMRHPIRSLRDLGFAGMMDLQLLLGGTAFALLVNPIMWLLTALYIYSATQGANGQPIAEFIRGMYPAPVYYAACYASWWATSYCSTP